MTAPRTDPAPPPLLELRDVGKDYGSVIALDGVSSTVRGIGRAHV